MPSLLLASHRVTRKCLLFLLIASIFSACAKQETLSDSQKDQILDTLQSAGRAYNAARANLQSPSGAHSPASGNVSDPLLRQMIDSLRKSIKARDCRIRMVAPDSYHDLSIIESILGIKRTFILLRVWGEKYCPITLDFKINTLLEPSLGRWAISYDYSYLVTNPSFKELNDVDAIELHGGVSLNGINTQQVRSETDLNGTIHSQAAGDIRLESYGKLEGASTELFSGETVWKLSYADFAAEFTRTYDNGQISFTINQEASTASDFDQLFAQGGDPFIYGANTSLVH